MPLHPLTHFRDGAGGGHHSTTTRPQREANCCTPHQLILVATTRLPKIYKCIWVLYSLTWRMWIMISMTSFIQKCMALTLTIYMEVVIEWIGYTGSLKWIPFCCPQAGSSGQAGREDLNPAVLYPWRQRSSGGLSRVKRDWIIPPIRVLENSKQVPENLVQVLYYDISSILMLGPLYCTH